MRYAADIQQNKRLHKQESPTLTLLLPFYLNEFELDLMNNQFP